MRISLVIPNRNHGFFLGEAIRSALAAGPPDLVETIVVDGASTDAETPKTLDRYTDAVSRVIVEPDLGIYDAVNKGFSHATGDIMGWLNSTDILLPNSLSVVADVFESFPHVEWITSRLATRIDESGRIIRQETHNGFHANDFFAGRHLPGNRNFLNSVGQESTFWRKSLWERSGRRLDHTFSPAADFELWSRFFQHAELWSVLAPIGAFRHHSDQLSVRERREYVAQGHRCIASTINRKNESVRRFLLKSISRRAACKLGICKPAPACIYEIGYDAWKLSSI